MTEEELERFFKAQQIRATISHYTANKRIVYYATVGEDHLPAILFIHGAPASMTIYKEFYKDEELLERFSLYALDRPGYGVTGGEVIPSIEKQAALILPLAERIHRVHQPVIVVGDSYGASVACRIVMDFPGIVQGLVLVSPSLGPGLEKKYWFTSLIESSFLKHFISAEFRSATKEKTRHRKELEKLLPLWERISIPVSYLQSKHDSIISSANADFAKQHMANVPMFNIHFFKGRKHNIVLKHEAAIRDHILQLYRILNQT